MKTIFLYGPPASGKTTLGSRLSHALSAPFVDLDAEIVAHEKKSVAALFAEGGEEAFRDLESAALKRVVSRCEGAPHVVALGGGTLLRAENRALCESAGDVLLLLPPSPEERARRISSGGATRPLGDRYEEREAHYLSFPRQVTTSFALKDSLVLVGESLAAPFLAGENVVADETVLSLYEKPLALAPLARQPSGERFKTLESVAALWRSFLQAHLSRRDRVVALGGGVTGDLTGFAAATFMRGIPWLNMPTTLLSMVDASTGGKTGCDLPEGKNLVGAFHSPALVVIDVDFLSTLPEDVLRQGKAEMVKHALVANTPHVFSPRPTAREIAESLAVKVNLVREDPLEKTGARALLNCGHTIGHALEKLSDYALSHGEAVAIGCVEEASLAAEMGLAPAAWPAEVAEAFRLANLPTRRPEGLRVSDHALWEVIARDKKRVGADILFALPCAWGDVRLVPVPCP